MTAASSTVGSALSGVDNSGTDRSDSVMLIRKCGFYITDGEIDQLDMDDDADGYYDGEAVGKETERTVTGRRTRR